MTILSGTKTILQGPAGTGKTYSIGTIVDAGYEVYYLGVENGLETLIGYFKDKGKEVPKNLHWHVVEPPRASFMELLDAATKINTLSFEALTKLSDSNRAKYDQFLGILKALNNFTDQRDDSKHGSVDSWGTDKVLVIDGLTGLSNAAMSMVTGGKPVRSMPDWAVAQSQVENLLRKLCDGCRCHVVLIAHVERETDQVLGGIKLTVSTLGKALAPKIPAMFSDVIMCVRTGDKWTWDTGNTQADVKARNLPWQANLPPDFAQILSRWELRNKEST